MRIPLIFLLILFASCKQIKKSQDVSQIWKTRKGNLLDCNKYSRYSDKLICYDEVDKKYRTVICPIKYIQMKKYATNEDLKKLKLIFSRLSENGLTFLFIQDRFFINNRYVTVRDDKVKFYCNKEIS
ncbi:MAG: hypothetical protein GDA46_04595 [Bdellovibrionales bacterium]|nr:hypothetical protein [Bdellovibrionales bacterium]